ncbi:MAG: protoglobin domain-containing protein [Propionibacteriaceae bacterium]|nr:protoglobin domain-containing protein [Propionibacteriaceae bacterium]
MDTLDSIAAAAITQIPGGCRFSAADAEQIARYRDELLSLTPELVQEFYDTLFDHPETAAIFGPGERATQEQTLTGWWRRTIAEPIDARYWSWMALIRLVHVDRNDVNTKMLSMKEIFVRFEGRRVRELIVDEAEAGRLVEALRRLTSTAGAIITHSFDVAVRSSLFEVAGIPQALLERMRDQEVNQAIVAARGRPATRP